MVNSKLVIRFLSGMVVMGILMLLLTYYMIKKEDNNNGKE